MNLRLAIIVVVVAILAIGCPRPTETPSEALRYESKGLEGNVRFTPVHIYLESEEEGIAAYQVEIVAVSGDAQIVGVEGSENPGFEKAPFYDPSALMGGKIVIAGFSTDTSLPRGKKRVATLHMRESGKRDVIYEIRTIAVADEDGSPIWARASARGK